MIYAILAQVLLLVTCYFLFNLLWLRGQDIRDLPLTLEYNATPVIVLLIKTIFEFLATVMLVVGVLVMLAIWLSPSMMFVLGPFMALSSLMHTFDNSFLSGVSAFLVAGVVSIILLVYGYFMAELVGALGAIAGNTKKGK